MYRYFVAGAQAEKTADEDEKRVSSIFSDDGIAHGKAEWSSAGFELRDETRPLYTHKESTTISWVRAWALLGGKRERGRGQGVRGARSLVLAGDHG